MGKLRNIKVGDTVDIECMTALGSGGPSKVTKITKLYDENSGKPYNVIWCGNHGFDARDGNAITSPTMYYIDI